MKREVNENLDKDELKRYIDELRNVLNEICATTENSKGLEERLIISQHLDHAIVEYMKNYEWRVTKY